MIDEYDVVTRWTMDVGDRCSRSKHTHHCYLNYSGIMEYSISGTNYSPSMVIAMFLKFCLSYSKCSLLSYALLLFPFLCENLKKKQSHLGLSTLEIRAILFHPLAFKFCSFLFKLDDFSLRGTECIPPNSSPAFSTMCGQLNPSSMESFHLN